MHQSGKSVDPDQMRDQALFHGLDFASIEAIAEQGWEVAEGRATRILSRGDYLEGMYTVFEGRLKLYLLSCNGDERVLRVLQPGDSFGEVIMFNSIPSPVFVETLSPVHLGYFPREAITEALARNPKFTASMLQAMSRLMRELIQDLESCCLQNARQRTVSFLLREADAGPPPHVAIELPAPKAVVASTLNLSAETFSRELHRLQGEGCIEIIRRTIYLRDRDRLVELAVGGEPGPASH